MKSSLIRISEEKVKPKLKQEEEIFNKGKNFFYNQAIVKKALDSFNEAISINQNYAHVYAEKANILRLLGNTHEALQTINKAIALNPDDVLAYYVKVSILVAVGKEIEAEKCHNTALRKHDNKFNDNNNYDSVAEVWFHKSNALYSIGRKEEAVECYDFTLKLSPKNVIAYINKGNALSDQGNKSKALECLLVAMKLYTGSLHSEAIASYNIASVLETMGKEHEKTVIQYYQITTFLADDNKDSYYIKGQACYALGKKQVAIEYFDKAIEYMPNNANAYFIKGQTLYDLGRHQEAIECFNEVNKLDPYNAQAYYIKGNAFYHSNNNLEALRCFDKVIEINPFKTDVYNNSAVILIEMGKKNEAIIFYDLAIKLNPNEIMYHCAKGKILMDFGKDSEALECFNKAYELTKSGIIQNNLTTDNINFINKTLANDREDLLKKLTEVQRLSTEIEKSFDELDTSDPNVQKTAEQFKNSLKRKSLIIEKAVDSLDPIKINANPNAHNHESNLLLLQQMNQFQAELVELRQITTKLIHEQQKQYIKLDKHNKLILENSKAIENVQKITLEIKTKIITTSKVTDKDKAIMEEKLSNISNKIRFLANQSDVEAITSEMSKLMLESRITKGRLIDIEDDIDRLLENAGEPLQENINVNMVTNIIYSNPLLNHPTLLQQASQHFGMNKTIDLSECLPKELVNEAITTNDSELILAGMISLGSKIN